jgi:hypothetical protein
MQKWEYDIEALSGAVDIKKLKAHGKDGWELVSMTSSYGEPGGQVLFVLVFKRPLQEQPGNLADLLNGSRRRGGS